MRILLERILTAALLIDIEKSPEKVAKLTIAIVNLTKTIRDTDVHNDKLLPEEGVPVAGSLEERLKGYVPSPKEIERLRAQLKERLKVLGPRLLEDGP